MTVLDVLIATLGAGFLSGFVPIVNIEAYLVGAAAISSWPASPGASCDSEPSWRCPASCCG